MTWTHKTRRIGVKVALGIMSCLMAGGTRAAAVPIPELPPQPLASALEAIARRAGLQLIYSSSLSNGVDSPGTSGVMRWEDALREVLRGTGLKFQLVNEHTVTIISDPNWLPPPTEPLPVELPTTRPAVPREAAPTRDSFEQVVITGSHIAGAAAPGTALVVLTRKDIDRSGYSTVQDVIRALPQNFGGGPSEDARIGLDAAFNSSRATGLNLRGLGSGSTLVLVNGRRLAASGSDGRFVDVSGIPLSAIERIEILPDGASAIYGADAVGGVVNFILRDDYEGIETQLKFGSVTEGGTAENQFVQIFGKHWSSGNALLSLEHHMRDSMPNAARRQSESSDLRSLGGDNFDIRESNPGTLFGPTGFWAIPKGQDGRSLEVSDLIAGSPNLFNRNEGWDLLPEHKRWSAVAIGRQQLTERSELFLDAMFAHRETEFLNPPQRQAFAVPETNPFYVNPTGMPGFVLMSYNFARDFGPERDDARVNTGTITLGGVVKLTRDWKLTGYGSHALARENVRADGVVNQTALNAALADPNPATAFNPFGDGSFTNPATLAQIRDIVRGERDAEISTVNLTVEGTKRIWSRNIRLAAGTDRRWQSMQTSLSQGGIPITSGAGDRDVASAYSELLIPLTAEDQSFPGLRRLELSLAARYERYNDFGGAAMPKVGLRWSPTQRISLRGSWARSFKAPNLADLDEGRNFLSTSFVPDPLAPGGASAILIRTGGNADLQEETARTWTAGIEYALPDRPASVSLGYFDILLRDRIDQVLFNTAVLTDPTYADVVSRDPTAAERAAICSRGTFIGGDPQTCVTLPVAAVVDLRFNNIAVTKTSGLDLLVSHDLQTRFGVVSARLNATHLLEYSRAQFRSSPLLSVLDTPNNPLEFKLRGSMSWDLDGKGVTASLNYVDGYTDNVSVPSRRVDSWTTLDLQARYGASAANPRRLDGITLSLNAQNIFDIDPPFLNSPEGYGYDASNADLLGRFVSFQVRKAW